MALKNLIGHKSKEETLKDFEAFIKTYSTRASYWQKMFQITIPLVRPNLTISTILNIIYVFNSFPIIWTITKGDPANRTDTLVTYLYKLAFYNGKQGQAAAVSVIGFLILLFCASLYMVSVLKKGDE